MTTEEIGKRLKKLREEKNLTLAQVGQILDVHKGTVQRYETGEIDIKRNIAVELGKIYGVSPAYIMGWSDNKNDFENLSTSKKAAMEKILSLLNEDDFDAAIKYAEYLAAKHDG